MLTRLIRGLGTACGYLAAGFLAAIAIATLLQIAARQMGRALETTELSGFFLAASTFLGLAYTFVRGGHVRIGLVSQFAGSGLRRGFEIWACLVALSVMGFMSWHMVAFTVETFRFGDLSPGLMAMPLWIPQAGVSFGLLVMLLAVFEQMLVILSGRDPDYDTNVDSATE